MGVTGPMARNVANLALLLSVQAGYDPRAPLSMEIDVGPFVRDVKGKRIAWAGNLNGFSPYEPGVLEVCRTALTTFETLGCVVDDAVPDYSPEKAWQAFIGLRGWQQGRFIAEHYNNPAHGALLTPEAIWEIETGARLSGFDVTAASVVRTDWGQVVRRLFERYEDLILPTAQLFPFPAEQAWPREIGGHAMQTYHDWMKAVCLITLSGCPALAVPAGLGPGGLPIGFQIVARVHQETACLRLAAAFEAADPLSARRLPPLLSRA
jgi:amidase